MDNGHQLKSEIKTNFPCAECDLYRGNRCRKWREEGSNPDSFTRDIFTDPEFVEEKEFISIEKACSKESTTYGNDYIGLTDEDIERLKNGEIIHIGKEYCTFIGYISKESENV